MGIVAGILAVALKAVTNEIAGGETGYILMIAAAIMAAWFGGLAAGLVATGVALVLDAALVTPGILLPGDRILVARQLIFVITSILCVVLVASRRASRDRLATAMEEVATLADAIEARDRRLELMLAASGTGFWEWDIDSGDLVWSESIFRQYGLEPTDIPPAYALYRNTIHPDDRAAFEAAIEHAMADGETFDLEFRITWPDGSTHWTRGSGRAFFDAAGRPIRMLGTGQDITQRKVLETERDDLVAEERRAGEFREAFIDVISHELRTPITTILGTTELLSRPGRIEDPEVRAAMLADTKAESERLYRLVEDLLVLGRVERGRLVADAEPIQLQRVLERVVAEAASELPSIHVTLEMQPDLPIVSGEATYIEQILRNLLENAAKYSPPGSAVVVRADAADATEVVVRVLDEGPGIPGSSLPHIFDLFYRDPSVARTASGSGIGLFVCRSLAEAQGGRIAVTERPEGGAEFLFSLPVLTSDEADELATAVS